MSRVSRSVAVGGMKFRCIDGIMFLTVSAHISFVQAVFYRSFLGRQLSSLIHLRREDPVTWWSYEEVPRDCVDTVSLFDISSS